MAWCRCLGLLSIIMVSEMGTAEESQGCLGVVERGNLAQER